MLGLSCNMGSLVVVCGSSSLTRYGTEAPYNGSKESQPLGHQGSLIHFLFIYLTALHLSCHVRDLSLRHLNSAETWDVASALGMWSLTTGPPGKS